MEIKNRFSCRPGFMVNFLLLCSVLLLFHLSMTTQLFSEENKQLIKRQASATPEKTDDFRDPFQPQIIIPREEPKMEEKAEMIKSRAQELFSLSIQGIIWGTGFPLAIINNQVLKKGQAFSAPIAGGGSEEIGIIDIEKDGVTITYSGGIEKLNYPGLKSKDK